MEYDASEKKSSYIMLNDWSQNRNNTATSL